GADIGIDVERGDLLIADFDFLGLSGRYFLNACYSCEGHGEAILLAGIPEISCEFIVEVVPEYGNPFCSAATLRDSRITVPKQASVSNHRVPQDADAFD